MHLFVCCVLLTGVAYGQVARDQLNPADKGKVADAIAKATQDNPESLYFVEQLARSRATQAIPMLEEKFSRTQDELDKAHVASALVRLGDQNDMYWDFLVKIAAPAVESDAPDFLSYNSQGKSAPGPSPEFVAWAKAHNVSSQSVAQEYLYFIPGKVGLLALTADPRGIPLLRKALLSPNHNVQIEAARGLAEIHDQDSLPLIIEASRRAPSEAAGFIASSLVYFDDPRAQSAVDTYVPKETAKALREARATGKKPFS